MARFTMPLLSPKQKKRLRRFLQDNFSTQDYPRPQYFSDQEAQDLRSIYAKDNARLFSEYLPQHSPEKFGY